MTAYHVAWIDVFAEAPLQGNPLAVVDDADDLDEATMRRLAGEFNQAETTFIMQSALGDRKLRSFTANGSEVSGAGHNALGAWLWLGYAGKLGDLSTPRTFQQEIGGVVLPITLEKTGDHIFGRMKQSPMTLGSVVSDVTPLAEALGLTPVDIVSNPLPRTVDTGASHLMVRLTDRATVDRAKPMADTLLVPLGVVGAEGVYVYAIDDHAPATAYARFFNPSVGLWEDSATGTAAGPLAAYLGHEGLLAAAHDLTIEQGTKMGRPSFIKVSLTPEPAITGGGVVFMRGRFEWPPGS